MWFTKFQVQSDTTLPHEELFKTNRITPTYHKMIMEITEQ